jgi:hypothetical protein
MSVVISSALAATAAFQANADTPLIGYETRVTTANISSTTETDDDPATNLANPSTALKWTGVVVSPAVDEYITVDVQTAEEMDYVGIARHNFGTAQITVSVEGVTDGDASPEVWEELVGETLLADDGPAIFRFTAQALAKIRLRLQPGSEAPTLAVLYTGKLLELERNIYVGHTPITLGRRTKTVTPRSESGNFLGRIVLNQMTETKVDLDYLTPDWYRANFDPFVEAAEESPLFFAWRPGDYPDEVGFCWLTNDPIPQNSLANGMMSVSLDLRGIVT